MPPMPTLQELIDTVRRDAGSDDPLAQLGAASAAVAELNEVGDGVLGHYVDRARHAGHSWTDISTTLGVSRQAAHKRFAATSAPVSPSLELFTARARRVLERSSDVARGLGHSYVGTEHLLLSLFTEPGCVAEQVLTAAGLTHAAVEQAVLRRAPRGAPVTEDSLPHTARAAAAIEATSREALQMGHHYIGTEHLLLALYADPVVAVTAPTGSAYRKGGGLAAHVLGELGLDRQAAFQRVVQLLADRRDGP